MKMKHKVEDLTAFCGLYCEDCIRYRCTASDLAEELLNEIGKLQFAEYAKVKCTHRKELNYFDSMVLCLRAISEIKCEVPCRLGGDGCPEPCEIIKCVKSKEIEGCWKCRNFEECDKLDVLRQFHGDAPINNLREIRKHGVSKWAEYRSKCYPWQ
jgi:hypothetical protein